MSRRTKIRIAVVGVFLSLLIIILVVFWLFGRQPQPVAIPTDGFVVPEEPNRLVVPTDTGPTGEPLPQEIEIDQADLESSLKAVATTFTERFGSFSNQSGFNNLVDLKDLMTPRMQRSVDNIVQTQDSQEDSSIYSGITTRALSARVTSLDLSFGQADVVVGTQRSETKGTTNNPRVYYQNLNLKLIQTGNGWKVDEANWE